MRFGDENERTNDSSSSSQELSELQRGKIDSRTVGGWRVQWVAYSTDCGFVRGGEVNSRDVLGGREDDEKKLEVEKGTGSDGWLMMMQANH